MPRILDAVADAASEFLPANPDQFFGLQLSRKLDDLTQIAHYVHLAESLPRHVLITAYHRARKRGTTQELRDRFRSELSGMVGSGILP